MGAALIAEGFRASVAAYVAILAVTVAQARTLEGQLEASLPASGR